MAAVLQFVQRTKKVEDVCSNKDEPAPVWVLDELVQMAQISADESKAIADALVKKLGHNSPVVKYKALRAMKFLCDKGVVAFQKCLSRNSAAIREMQHYQGQPDTLKGDALNKRVREIAKETVESIFQAAPTVSSLHQSRMQGFANQSMSSDGMYGMQSSSSDFHASASTGNLGGMGGKKMIGFGNTFNSKSSTSMSAAAGWNALSDSSGGGALFGNGDSNGAAAARSGRALPHSSGSGKVVVDECDAVNDICTPGGVRPVPSKDDLRRFIESIGSLDGTKVAQLLEEKLTDGSWQVNLRALCAVESVMTMGSSTACGEIAVYFTTNADAITACTRAPTASVKDRARRVLSLLGIDTGTPHVQRSTSAAARQSSNAEVNLLGEIDADEDAAAPSTTAASGLVNFLDSPVATSNEHHASSNTAVKEASIDALFSGLSVGHAANGAVDGGAAASALHNGSNGLFAGLNLHNDATAAANTHAPSTPPSKPQASHASAADDLLAFGDDSPAQVQPQMSSMAPQQSSAQPPAASYAQPQPQQQFAAPTMFGGAPHGSMQTNVPHNNVQYMPAGMAGYPPQQMGVPPQQLGVPLTQQLQQPPYPGSQSGFAGGQMTGFMNGMAPPLQAAAPGMPYSGMPMPYAGMLPHQAGMLGFQPQYMGQPPTMAMPAHAFMTGSGAEKGPIPLAAFAGNADLTRHDRRDSHIPAFDFIGEHMNTLTKK